ncbi:MAG: TIGR00303 family protein [Chloroflexi bacterium]|nr:TIGR00303 family protein [Chloroflexota bacterium]
MIAKTGCFPHIDDLPILLVHAEQRGRTLVECLRGRRPHFACIVAHTETAEIDGLSAAGTTAELRRLTATADVEALFHGRPRCMQGVPSNPLGAPGPVLITLAGLRLTGMQVDVLDAGLRIKPDAPTTVLADRWGASIETGRAVPHAAALFEQGLQAGEALAARGEYLLVAESVPGGTTTAQALLCGLGIDAWGKVSSSMPNNAHPLKAAVVTRALTAAGLLAGPEYRARPALEIVAAVGDPMQPVAAGVALAALRRGPVLLAGGSQMLAVAALLLAIARECGDAAGAADRLAVATTGWVARDPTADLGGLAAQIGDIPVLASDLDFGTARNLPLRRYEDFLVKEGVGAGAAAIAASLVMGADATQLLREVERVYEDIYGLDRVASGATASGWYNARG